MSYLYKITPDMALNLQAIERVKTAVGMRPISAVATGSLRIRARIRSAHFSTRIEGNRLDLEEVERAVLKGERVEGKEGDRGEVQRYFHALEKIEAWVDEGRPVTEGLIQELHAIIFTGKKAKPTPYRDGQNAVRDAASGDIVYMPPEAKDVPGLMKDLVGWIKTAEKGVPIPIAAGMAHYQIATIHPWYDGNGRTARALATWILYRNAYDLGRMVSLEEEYADDLAGYYAALQTSPQHNYYDGRNASDVTPWLEYFLKMMEQMFERLAGEVQKQNVIDTPEARHFLRILDRRARLVLGLLAEKRTIKNKEVANLLGLSERQTRELMSQWVQAGWLEMADESRKARQYQVAEKYRRFIGDLSAD